jgi:Ca2+-binding RTX toxin-like protein
MAFSSESITSAGSGLVFVNSYDGNVSAQYRSAVITAENYLQSQFTNSVTVDITFSFSALGSGVAAQNSFSTLDVSYAALTAALRAHATTADDQLAVNGLPAFDPSNGAGFGIAFPEAVILGLASSATAHPVQVTLNSSLPWSFGQDAVGALEHEITEGAFGRLGGLGFSGTQWGILDLFRFTATGARDYTGGSDGVFTYFGLDSSHVLGPAFHNSVDMSGAFDGSDLGDWNNTRSDAFGPGGPNSPGAVTPTDLRVLDVLGWTPTGSASSGQVLNASAASPTVTGGAGTDTITGWAGGDVLRGGDGNDSIQGGSGFDDINGNKGEDTIDGGSGGQDWLVGGQGNDLIVSHSAGNILYGNLGNDTIQGGTGGEIIRGGQGDDVITVGSGAEWVSGDRGNDTIQGGSGPDTFHTFGDAGLDRVIGFSEAKGDHVQLDPGTVFTVSQVGSDTVISMTGGGQMVLVGVQADTLHPGWIFGA